MRIGQGVPRSDADALKLLRLASSQGHYAAQWSLGIFYEQGRGGLDADVDETVRLYKLAAASGFTPAVDAVRRLGFSPSGTLVCRTCFALAPAGTELQRCSGCKEAHYCGTACQRADWGPRHKDECKAWRARQAAQKAAMANEKAAGQRWGDRPVAELRKAAENGVAVAQCALGECYLYGLKGFAKSPKLGAEWFAKAATAGVAHAQESLDLMHFHGAGIARDLAEAARCLRLAAKQGQREAMYNLAMCLYIGDGCDTDPVQAVQWMRRAVELGVAGAQTELARWYMKGDCGLPVSYKEAHRLARLGTDQGNAFAMFHLGKLFYEGWGVAKDLDEACKWLRQAAALGQEAAKDNLRILALEGHPSLITAVRELGLGPL